MKGKTKNRDLRDIGGTNIIPISSLAYLMGAFNLSSLAHPWPLILYPHSMCGYCQNSFTTLTNNRKDTL